MAELTYAELRRIWQEAWRERMASMADEAIKDECKICDLVLVAVGLAVAGILTYMAVDLATSGKLSAMFSRPLATVTQLREEGDDAAG